MRVIITDKFTMKPKLILCLALVLSGGLFGCATTDSRSGQTASSSNNPKPSFESVQKMFEQNDWQSLEKVDAKIIKNFNSKQRNAIAVLAAKAFAESVASTNITDEVQIRPVNPVTGLPIALHFGMELVSFEILSDLEEDNAITTKDIIPYFIQGLGDDDFDQLQCSLSLLGNLTGRVRSPNSYIYESYDFLETNRPAIVDWWRNWWQENQDKHPIFDADLKKILRQEVLKIDKQIMRASPPDTWPDNGAEIIRGSDWQSKWPQTDSYQVDGNSVFVFWYDNIPGSGTGYIDPARGDNSLCIRGDFLTKSLQFGTNEVSSATSPDQKMQEIFHETVKGTGIELKVNILTTNTALINVLRDKLNK
jgi:hypothetical protein